jgi:hypothetical protein
MPTNLLTLITVDYADSQPGCLAMVNRDPPVLALTHSRKYILTSFVLARIRHISSQWRLGY